MWKAEGRYVFDGKDCIGICDTDNRSDAVMRSNARLMAAAPDLLVALKEVVRVADRKTNEFDLAREAIAKAENV
jgi:hypothetical protein